MAKQRKRRLRRVIRADVVDPVAVNMRNVPRQFRHSLRIYCEFYGWSVEEFVCAVVYDAMRRANKRDGAPWTAVNEILAYRRRYGNGKTW